MLTLQTIKQNVDRLWGLESQHQESYEKQKERR